MLKYLLDTLLSKVTTAVCKQCKTLCNLPPSTVLWYFSYIGSKYDLLHVWIIFCLLHEGCRSGMVSCTVWLSHLIKCLEVLSHDRIRLLSHFLQTFLSLFFFSPSCMYQLETGPHAPVYQLLNLFAYGTYSDYKGKQKNLKKSFDLAGSALSDSGKVLTQVCPAQHCSEY